MIKKCMIFILHSSLIFASQGLKKSLSTRVDVKLQDEHRLKQIDEHKEKRKAAIIVACVGGALIGGSRRLLQVEYTEPSTRFCLPPVLVVAGCE